MTANEAHVRAVAEALALLDDCPVPRDVESWMPDAAAVVATLTPLIAAEVRAEVAALALAFDPQRDDAETWDHGGFVLLGDRCPEGEGAAIRWALRRFAARIATEETP